MDGSRTQCEQKLWEQRDTKQPKHLHSVKHPHQQCLWKKNSPGWKLLPFKTSGWAHLEVIPKLFLSYSYWNRHCWCFMCKSTDFSLWVSNRSSQEQNPRGFGWFFSSEVLSVKEGSSEGAELGWKSLWAAPSALQEPWHWHSWTLQLWIHLLSAELLGAASTRCRFGAPQQKPSDLASVWNRTVLFHRQVNGNIYKWK